MFLAEHPRISKRVAVKVINAELSTSPEMVSRFLAEARAASQISHENVVDILDFGQTPQGDNFMIMEYLEGQTLTARVRSAGRLDLPTAQRIGSQIAEALVAAHGHGVIHRDLKPDNIYIVKRSGNPDYVKILDFGLAKLLIGSEGINHKTSSGSVLGTPHYMAPEQCEGRSNVDGRADLYSLGCILFFTVCGELPFPGDGFAEVILKHISEPPPSPRSINPAVTPAFEKLVLHCLAKKRENRFQKAEDVVAALRDPEKWSQEFGDDPQRIVGPATTRRAGGEIGASVAQKPALDSMAQSSVIAPAKPSPIAKSSGVSGSPTAAPAAKPAAPFLGATLQPKPVPAAVLAALGNPAPPPVAAPPPTSAPPPVAAPPPTSAPPPVAALPLSAPPRSAPPPSVPPPPASISQLAETPVVANRSAPQMPTMIGEMPAAALSALMKPPPPNSAATSAIPTRSPTPPSAIPAAPATSAPAAMTQIVPSNSQPPIAAHGSHGQLAPVPASASQPPTIGVQQPLPAAAMTSGPVLAPVAMGAASSSGSVSPFATSPQSPQVYAAPPPPATDMVPAAHAPGGLPVKLRQVLHKLTPYLNRLAMQPWAQRFIELPPPRRLMILRGCAAAFGSLVLLLLIILLWPGPRVVILRSTPDQAEVMRGDVSLGTTPLVVELKRGEKQTLTLRKEGFDDLSHELGPDSEKVVLVKMTESPPEKTADPGKKPVVRPSGEDDSSDDENGGGSSDDPSKKKKKKKKKKVVVF